MTKASPETIFTLSAGRTGTAWLSDFLAVNFKCDALHEPLGIEDFGNRMPDIKIMRSFNETGNNAIVKNFWKRKLSMLTSNMHIETNHTLGKCGLIENISHTQLAEKSKIIILKRDIVRQCASYVMRHDFVHITTAWQWYLHPSYQKKIIDPELFSRFEGIGLALWYCYEMAARQAYYKLYFGSKVKFIDAQLEDITTPSGAQKFWQAIGQSGQCSLPPRKNENRMQTPKELIEHLAKITSKFQFDPNIIAQQAFDDGFSFEHKQTA